MTITSCNSITYWFHRLKSTQIHVPWRCLVASLNYLSMLSFVIIVKTIPCSFNGMTWLLSLLTCKAFAVQSKIMSSRSNKYQYDKVFGTVFYFEWTNTTSRKYKLTGISQLGDSWTTFRLCFHVFRFLFLWL